MKVTEGILAHFNLIANIFTRSSFPGCLIQSSTATRSPSTVSQSVGERVPSISTVDQVLLRVMEEEVEGEVVVVDGRVRCGGDNDSGEVQFYYYEDDSHSSLWGKD